MTTTTQLPKVTAIVLNWNRRDDTLRTVTSLARVSYARLATIVVDNASDDDSVAAIRRAYPGIDVIENTDNLGYAGGNNVGIVRALADGADYVLVLNNDVTLDRDAISHAVAVAQGCGDCRGVVGFAVYRPQPDDALPRIGLSDGLHSNFHLTNAEQLDECEALPIDSAYGCAMLLSRKMIETVGLFDEDFFLVHEELDLCRRARRADFQVVAATRARVWHADSASFGGEDSPLRLFYLRRNWPLHLRKYFSSSNDRLVLDRHLDEFRVAVRWHALQYLVRADLRRAFAVLAALRCADRGLWGRKRIPMSLRLRVYADFISVPAATTLRRMRRLIGFASS